jgi:hypothetical protein
VPPTRIEHEKRGGWADPEQKPEHSLNENPGASVNNPVCLEIWQFSSLHLLGEPNILELKDTIRGSVVQKTIIELSAC